MLSLRQLALGLGAAVLLAAGTASAATPKPWMWPAAKMNTRMMAASPFVWDEARLQKVTCAGRGKQVAGRFTRFSCRIAFGDINSGSPYGAELVARVLPVGSGKLCIPVGPDGMAVTSAGTTAGVKVAPNRACV